MYIKPTRPVVSDLELFILNLYMCLLLVFGAYYILTLAAHYLVKLVRIRKEL
jgi:hypothetical protein